MRRYQPVRLVSICLIIVLTVMGLNAAVLQIARVQYAPDTTSLVSLFNISGQVREWSGYARQWRELGRENAALKEALGHYVSNEAKLESLTRENEALRKAAGLSSELKRQTILAGMFDVSLLPDRYSALINKGQNDGVAADNVVVSTEGVLIGKVTDVFGSSARVILIADPNFSVTVRVLNGTASGILRGALADGMELSLVTQEEVIAEGDTVISTGDDAIPSGLIVGTVRNVQDNDTQLFKKVSVNPSATFRQGGVIVVGQ